MTDRDVSRRVTKTLGAVTITCEHPDEFTQEFMEATLDALQNRWLEGHQGLPIVMHFNHRKYICTKLDA